MECPLSQFRRRHKAHAEFVEPFEQAVRGLVSIGGKPAMGSLRQSSCSGFTLIELMFVTVVVAILAALLLPALGRAKASAQSARCKSNLRQLQQGVQMFADENHGTRAAFVKLPK